MAALATQPLKILIAAMGGEGGGVLMSWIIEAARRKGYPVQGTSIPGVAQRTGATTYYVEMLPETPPAGAPRPVFALSPTAGEVDLMVATELAEAARAVALGFVSRDRTTLIASTHRVYATIEKMAMGDGRLDPAKLRGALEQGAKSAHLFDAAATAQEAGTIINAVMLGAMAGTGLLGIAPEEFTSAIEAEAKAVAANLAGFNAGFAIVTGARSAPDAVPGKWADRKVAAEVLLARARAEFPAEAQEVLGHAIPRLVDYQDGAYATRYLDRLSAFNSQPAALLAAVARHLAVRMSFEDIIRVAQAKTRADRYARVRGETGAGDTEPVIVTEFFKPGIPEVCDILPAGLARRILAWAERSGRLHRTHWGMEVKTSTVTGFAKVRFLASLRRWRPRSHRWAEEQAAIDAWLALVKRAAEADADAALEVAELARLIKGYGATHRRGSGNYARIVRELVEPALAAGVTAGLAGRIRTARDAALADPEGEALGKALTAAPAPLPKAAE